LGIKHTALAVTATFAVAIGIAVYQRAPDRVWNRLFAVHAAGGGIWTFLNYLVETAQTPAQAGLWLRLTHPVVAMVICTVVEFAWTFPERIDYVSTRRRAALYGIGAFFGMAGLAPDLYHDIQLTGGTVLVDYGWPFIPFGIFTVVALGYTDVVLLRKARRLEGVQRVQVLWVLVGLAGSHLIACAAIIVIPMVWGTTAYSGWGAGGYITTLAGMGYAIAKHRLMQPETALRRGLSTALAVSAVIAIGIFILRLLEPTLVANGMPPRVGYIGVGLFMGMLIVLVYGQLNRTMRQARSSGSDPASVQAETSSQILRTLNSEHLLALLARALDDALQPTDVVVYTRSRAGAELVPGMAVEAGTEHTAPGRPGIDPGHPILDLVRDGSLLTRDQVFRFASQDRARRLSAAMDQLGAQIVAPLIWEDQLIGAVTLGAKRSGEMYTEEELRFVGDVALQASLAIRNADLYAETAALKDFNERILTQMDNAVVVTDEDECIMVFNPAAERLFDISVERAQDSTIDVLPEGIANCIRASIMSGRILPGRQFTIERGDDQVPLACSTSPLESDSDDRRQGAVAVISDLTLIQELERERQEAERLALIRVISAGMAHEIRNPLVAIRTFAELAPRRLDDPEFRSNFLTVVQEEIRRIDKLVGDLLTLSKPADAVVEEIDVDLICRGVMRAMAGVAETSGVQLHLELGRLDGVAHGDETRLHQALLNLVSNAIDAETEGGSVTLATEECGDSDEESYVRITVHNPGSFIPPEQTDEIFRPFVSKKTKGTGLGLAICQTIIEEHRGKVRVESSPEDGTTFVVELPLSRSRTTAPTGEF
jgi:signal transduction histidine kinase